MFRLLVLHLALIAGVALAATPNETNRRAASLYYEGHYAEAESLLAPLASSASIEADPEAHATALNDLGVALASQRRWSEAEPYLRSAREIRERRGGPARELAITTSNLAEVLRAQGRYPEAAALQEKAAELEVKTVGGEADGARSLRKLAGVRASQGRYNDAISLMKRALEMREKLYGKDHPKVAEYLKVTGELYLSQGKSAEASPLYARASKILEKSAPSAPAATDRPVVNVPFALDKILTPKPAPTIPPGAYVPPPPRETPRPSPVLPRVRPVAPPSPRPVDSANLGPVSVLKQIPDANQLSALMQGSPRRWIIELQRWPDSNDAQSLLKLPGTVGLVLWTGDAPSGHNVSVIQNGRIAVTLVLTRWPEASDLEALRGLGPLLRAVYLTSPHRIAADPRTQQLTTNQGYVNPEDLATGLGFPSGDQVALLDRLPVAPRIALQTSGLTAHDVSVLARLRRDAQLTLNCIVTIDDGLARLLDQVDRPLQVYAPVVTRIPSSAAIQVHTGGVLSERELAGQARRSVAR